LIANKQHKTDMKHCNHFARVVYQIILFGSVGPEW